MHETHKWTLVGADIAAIKSLMADAARWRYVRDNLAQASGPKMDGNWTWRFRFPSGRARTIDELIDRKIAESNEEPND